MIKYLIRYPLLFVWLVLLQVLILNNVQFSGYINPYLYLLFILVLPLETPNWALLLIACILGLSIDAFTSTLGMHTSASIFLAFCRPFVLRFLAPRDGYENKGKPGINEFGFKWFLAYSSILVLLHHFFLFSVEVFSFQHFGFLLARWFLSSLFTIFLIIIAQFFTYNAADKG